MNDSSEPALKKQALAELKTVLRDRNKFVKAHAAEYLIWSGYKSDALKAFLAEEKASGTEPKYRIVIWRILAQAERTPAARQVWLNKMYAAYADLNGPDRTHATESLAKLKQPVAKLYADVTAKTLAADDRMLQTYALWASSYGSAKRMADNREKLVGLFLKDSDVIVRRISGYVLRREKGLSLPQWQQIANVAGKMPQADELHMAFLTTAIVTAPIGADKAVVEKLMAALISDAARYNVAERNELAMALADKGEKKHLAVLADLLNNKGSEGKYDAASDEAADMRAAAAYAILSITKRLKL